MFKQLVKPVGVDCKYFEGKVVDVKATPSGNFLVFASDTGRVCLADDGVTVFNNKHSRSDMNFLVPRRRVRVVDSLKYLEVGRSYVFKLIPERFSGKFCVAEVFVK